MITEHTGSIFTSKADALVCPVNCVGVMGGGLALAFKLQFPALYGAYFELCTDKILRMGKPLIHIDYTTNKNIILFPTKDHYKHKSYLIDIKAGLKNMIEKIPIWGIKSIATPRLGCGLGGLDWNDVKPLIISEFESLLNFNAEIWNLE